MWLEALGRGLRGSFLLSLARSGACVPAASLSSAPGGCWSCGAPLSAAAVASPRFCPSCRALQPPEPGLDYFRLMGCDRVFRLDLCFLRRTFLSLQRALHPDLFAGRSQAERGFSAQYSSLVNEAFRTLRDPIRRGLYLLELSGFEPGTETASDPGFLSEVLEANERLSDAEDAAEDVQRLVAERKEELAERVAGAFDRGDLREAKRLLGEMNYFANLEEKVKAKKVPPN